MSIVSDLVARARAAQEAFANATQQQADDAVTGLAWALYEPGRARALAEQAVADTGVGNVADKIVKNQRKTFGALRDLLRAKSVGIIEEDPARGIVKYAKPVGVVAAITPSTNPAATPVNKAMFAVKGRNAIIIAPSPGGYGTTSRVVEHMRDALERTGAPRDLVLILPLPVSKEMTSELMRLADLVVATGSQSNVRAAYASGAPAIGVGQGNVPVIIDASADLDAAARKICASKTFDNATSCSSENAVIILDSVYDAALAALERAGGHLATAGERERILERHWVNGKLNRKVIGRGPEVVAEALELGDGARSRRFFMVEETGVGAGFPLSGEKLSLVLTVYRASDFDAAVRIASEILQFQGKGHSVGVHTAEPRHARRLAEELPGVRVLVNQAHTFGNGGGFDNGLNFTLSMGCGSWGRNSISENLSYRHFLNITHLVTCIPEDRPSEEELFGAWWARYGK
jgi:sulfoacetaldehyde dehydrogenase